MPFRQLRQSVGKRQPHRLAGPPHCRQRRPEHRKTARGASRRPRRHRHHCCPGRPGSGSDVGCRWRVRKPNRLRPGRHAASAALPRGLVRSGAAWRSGKVLAIPWGASGLVQIRWNEDFPGGWRYRHPPWLDQFRAADILRRNSRIRSSNWSLPLRASNSCSSALRPAPSSKERSRTMTSSADSIASRKRFCAA